MAEVYGINAPRPINEEIDGDPSARYGLIKWPNGALQDGTSFFVVLSTGFNISQGVYFGTLTVTTLNVLNFGDATAR